MARNAFFLTGLVAAAVLCAAQGRDFVKASVPGDHDLRFGSRGSVKVTVFGDRGLPVHGAKVTAVPITKCALAYALPECLTDSTGSCSLDLYYDQKCGGKYSITASKVEDGYPPMDRWFYAAADPAFKETDIEMPVAHWVNAVTVHLGKRAGILTGTVRDAATGRPMDPNVLFHWVSNPRNFLGTGLNKPRFRILVPPDTPITMVVSQKGYEDWTYSLGRGTMKNAIRLGPGEEMRLDIRLRPRE